MFTRPLLSQQQLQDANARLVTYPAKHQLYEETQSAKAYYQLETGLVRDFNFGEEQDFIQKIYFPKESVGDAALVGGYQYTANAETIIESQIWEVPKAAFLRLLREQPELLAEHNRRLAQTIRFQCLQRRNTHLLSAQQQLLAMLRYLAASDFSRGDTEYLVPFTRQQLANMLGLRVETVIRLVRELEKKRQLQLVDHKIILPLNPATVCCEAGFSLLKPTFEAMALGTN